MLQIPTVSRPFGALACGSRHGAARSTPRSVRALRRDDGRPCARRWAPPASTRSTRTGRYPIPRSWSPDPLVRGAKSCRRRSKLGVRSDDSVCCPASDVLPASPRRGHVPALRATRHCSGTRGDAEIFKPRSTLSDDGDVTLNSRSPEIPGAHGATPPSQPASGRADDGLTSRSRAAVGAIR